ncbi:unnamed protein product [Polarella glacialis]|uniref:Protein kinase domain-containing protein n=1 Tax=Polarella glacialis TaxID=89957 RepID=A0A813LS70_POLGL|nr:unnamed protein product [Polarella glacialis]
MALKGNASTASSSRMAFQILLWALCARVSVDAYADVPLRQMSHAVATQTGPEPFTEVATLEGHTSWVFDVVFNPDGGLLASGSFDMTVKVFATSTWTEVTTLTEHTSWVRSVAFNPDGGLLASGSRDKTVKVFATSTWTEVTTLTEHTSSVRSVALNPGGGLLASGSVGKTVKVFATSTWTEVTTLTEHTSSVRSVAFNPDGGLLASGSSDGPVKVFATSTWAEVRTLAEHTGSVDSVAFSPDGGLLASGSLDNSNPFDGIDVEWGAKPVAVDWDGDGDIDLLVGHQDGRIQFFERTADASLVERTGSSNPFDGIFDGIYAAPFAVDWDGDGDVDLLVGNQDGRIQLFERTADASLVERTGNSNPFDGIYDNGFFAIPFAVDWDGDGDIDLLVGKFDSRILLFQRSADASLVQLTTISNPINSIDVRFSASPFAVDWDGDGDIDLLVGHQDGRIQFFERTANAKLVERTGSSNPFDGINAAPFPVDWDGDGDIDLLVGSITASNVKGTMALDVPNCTAFTQRKGAIGAVAAGIANATGVDAKSVQVTLTCSRRLTSEGLFVRRLEAVNGAYEITIPAGTTITETAIITTGSAGLTAKIAAAMTAAGITDITVKDLWGPESSVSVYVVDASGLSVADPSVESCSEGVFQSSDMQHIMTIGIAEHWFIKPSDITPGSKSILGSGSFGIVVKGMLNHATEVAIKIPKTRFQSREESQLANEMRLFRHIRHSNIVLFHGATLMVINGGSPCLSLVLEWVDGGNFGEYMQQLRSNAVFEADGHAFAYKILLDVARGMTYLHKLTPVILHLDLKPANILVEKSVPPKGKITDFGLSRFARNSLPQPKVGTEKYMAPEVAQRKPYGPAADVFSFGRVIIWTITGELCPELISSRSSKGREDACLFQTLDEVASSCLEEDSHMRPHFFQVYDRLTTPPPTTTTKIVPPLTTTTTKIVL